MSGRPLRHDVASLSVELAAQARAGDLRQLHERMERLRALDQAHKELDGIVVR